MTAAEKRALFKKTWGQVQKELRKVLSDNRVREVQGLVKKFLNNAQRDYMKLVKGDIHVNINNIRKELKVFEKMINHLVKNEIKKAESFLSSQKSELTKFQRKLESALKKRGLKIKTSTKKKSTKKTTKKATKKVS